MPAGHRPGAPVPERGRLPRRRSAAPPRAPRVPAATPQAAPLDNLLERSLEEVKRRAKVIGRFPGETSCISLSWAVLDLFIASDRGLGLTALEHRQLAQMVAARMVQPPDSLTA